MARRRTQRRRQAIPRIGTAPGQRGRLVIEPSELLIEREADRVILHDQGGTQTHTLAGNQHHIYLHSGQRERPLPEPERPESFFNFDELRAELNEKTRKMIKQEKVVPGAKTPKYVSRWGSIAKNVAHPMDNVFGKNTWNFKGHGWLPIRPFKLLDAMGADLMFSQPKKAGVIRLWKDKRAYSKAMKFNERFRPRAAQIIKDFRAETRAALAELQRLVGEGRINRENRNFYFEKYEKAVRKAEIKFRQGISRLISDYMKEWKGKKAAA